jgi:hypothetical protein
MRTVYEGPRSILPAACGQKQSVHVEAMVKKSAPKRLSAILGASLRPRAG